MSVLVWDPQVNKFERISSDGHQMSLSGAGPGPGGPMSDVWGWGEERVGGTMSDGLKLGEGTEAGGVSEIQCIMDNSHMGTLPDPVNRQHTIENITVPQLRWRAVNIGSCYSVSLHSPSRQSNHPSVDNTIRDIK